MTFQAGADPHLGRTLGGQYRIEALLGCGGMGRVYRGLQLSVNRPVAIKLITGSAPHPPEWVRRFQREAEATARLSHPNSVRLFDFGVTEAAELYMVMELLEGTDLAQQLEQGPLLLPDALSITRQVLLALSEAHALGIVHRDIKPDNVFLARVHGGDLVAKVMDFGIAGLDASNRSAKLTGTGVVIGTPTYMSPEQAQGLAVDPRSDLYSLGVVLFEMLSGRPLFESDTAMNLLLAHISRPPRRLSELGVKVPHQSGVQTLLDGLLAKDPQARPSITQALEAVAALSTSQVRAGTLLTGAGSLQPRSSTRLSQPVAAATPDSRSTGSERATPNTRERASANPESRPAASERATPNTRERAGANPESRPAASERATPNTRERASDERIPSARERNSSEREPRPRERTRSSARELDGAEREPRPRERTGSSAHELDSSEREPRPRERTGSSARERPISAERARSHTGSGVAPSTLSVPKHMLGRRWALLALAAALPLAAAGAFALRGIPAPAAATESARPAKAPAAPASAPLQAVTISSDPIGASVHLKGTKLGTTPYVFHFQQPTELTLARRGYEPRVVQVAPGVEPTLEVKLEREPTFSLKPRVPSVPMPANSADAPEVESDAKPSHNSWFATQLAELRAEPPEVPATPYDPPPAPSSPPLTATSDLAAKSGPTPYDPPHEPSSALPTAETDRSAATRAPVAAEGPHSGATPASDPQRTGAPSTGAPRSDAPSTGAPRSDAPSTGAPRSDAPAQEPATRTPAAAPKAGPRPPIIDLRRPTVANPPQQPAQEDQEEVERAARHHSAKVFVRIFARVLGKLLIPDPPRERRAVLAEEPLTYKSFSAAHYAYKDGRIDRTEFQEAVWQLRQRRRHKLIIERENLARGAISQGQYDARVDRIWDEFWGS